MKSILLVLVIAMVCMAYVAADADLDKLIEEAGKSMEALGNKWTAEGVKDPLPAKNPICFVCKLVCGCK